MAYSNIGSSSGGSAFTRQTGSGSGSKRRLASGFSGGTFDPQALVDNDRYFDSSRSLQQAPTSQTNGTPQTMAGYGVPMTYAPTDGGLGGKYMRQQRDIGWQYGRDALNNAYGRFISQQRGNRALGDMTRGFEQGYAPQRANLGRRGMLGPGVNSGVQRETMGRYVDNYVRPYMRTQQDITQNLQQYDLNQMNLDAWRQQALADLEAQKQNEIASSAKNIQFLRDQIGGL